MPNLTVPPPNLSPNFATWCYPRNTEKLRSGVPAEEQMRRISFSRREYEFDQYQASKGAGWAEMREELYETWENNKPYCRICSEFPSTSTGKIKPIYHIHHSSKDERTHLSLDQYANYQYSSCQVSPHPCKIGVRYPVLMTSSMLHNWRTSSSAIYTGDSFHVDTISIPGATLPNLVHAWEAEYKYSHRPVDVLVCAGLNDIIWNVGPEQFLERMNEFRAAVMHTEPEKLELANSLAFCTLPFPPMATVLNNDPRQNTRLDFSADLVELNNKIKDFNMAQNHLMIRTSRAPQFHTWGTSRTRAETKPVSSPKTPVEVRQHRLGSWREDDINKKLHLNDITRMKMGRATVNYFRAIYWASLPDRNDKENRKVVAEIESL